ncbi:hypothetical protein AY599_14445 [Leptolyngbya valderiana BDU 20041]|nr:DUF1350 family protein [Geitlerinema sp. CS-897]OAB62330.1 hypothetical protein AY599_14445 [Leptolyngbya valderiana BDU 20041]PPT06742.1 hypothetical protein CKA32_000334 [Geitlerinema sp. FC II]
MTNWVADWQDVTGSAVLLPANPRGIVHFLGGAFVAAAPQITYKFLLEFLARQRYVVVATPFVSNSLDHAALAQSALHSFETTIDRLLVTGRLRKRYLPVYSVGHSLGCKLHLLIGSLFSVERAGNISIAYNNYPARRSIPFLEQLSNLTELEFTPTPDQTHDLIAREYCVRRNLLVQFKNDDIDQTSLLHDILQKRFSSMVTLQTLNGTHTTPIAQDVNWQVGEAFSPLDAVGQWVKQSVYRDLNRLMLEMMRWLDPTAKVRST